MTRTSEKSMNKISQTIYVDPWQWTPPPKKKKKKKKKIVKSRSKQRAYQRCFIIIKKWLP